MKSIFLSIGFPKKGHGDYLWEIKIILNPINTWTLLSIRCLSRWKFSPIMKFSIPCQHPTTTLTFTQPSCSNLSKNRSWIILFTRCCPMSKEPFDLSGNFPPIKSFHIPNKKSEGQSIYRIKYKISSMHLNKWKTSMNWVDKWMISNSISRQRPSFDSGIISAISWTRPYLFEIIIRWNISWWHLMNCILATISTIQG